MHGRRVRAVSHLLVAGLLAALLALAPEVANAAAAVDASVPNTAHAKAMDLEATTAQTQGTVGSGPVGPAGPEAPQFTTFGPDAGSSVSLDGGLPYHGDPDRSQGRTEVVGERTATAKVFGNADGTKTMELHPGPVHFIDGTGTWVDIDTTLVSGPEGLRPRSTKYPVVFAATNTGSQLAVVSLGAGRSVSWTLSGADAAAASSDGHVATYAGVRPGVDLELGATYTGIKEDIVLHDAAAPTTFDFPLALTGLSARSAASGIELVGLDSKVAAVIPAGFALDAAHARTEKVTISLVGTPVSPVVRVSLDPAWLADPARSFPVRIDPTLTTNTGDDTFVTAFNSTNHSAEGGLEVGANYVYGVESVMLLKFPGVSALTNKHIISSNLGLYQTWAYGCATRTYGAFRMTQDWNPSTVQYNDVTAGPAYDAAGGAWEQNLDYWGGCGRGQNWVSFGPSDLAKMNAIIYAWAHGEAPNYGFAVRASDPSDTWSNRTYASMNTPYSVPPTLSVTYSDWGATYAGASWASLATPSQAGTLNLTVKNTGSYTWPANGPTRLSYHLRDPVTNSVIVWDGPRTYLPQDVPPNASITLPMTVAAQPAGDYRIELDMVEDGVTWSSTEGVPTSAFTHRYSDAPTLSGPTPINGATLKSTSPTLSVTVQNPDSFPAGNIGTQFSLCTDPAMTAGCSSSAWLSSPATSGESTNQTWSPGTVNWETPYFWTVKVQEQAGSEWPPAGYGSVSAPMTFHATIAQPDSSHLGLDPHAGSVAGINPFSRNAMLEATDIDLPGAGPQAGAKRTYNSADGRTGVFGLGWSSVLDMRVSPGRSVDYRGSGTADSALVTFADGRTLRFPRNPDGTLSGPFGMADQLSADANGFTYTDAETTVWSFDRWGRLSSVTDRLGLGLSLTKASGVVPLRRFVDCAAPATSCARPDPGSAITRDFATTATFGPNSADANLFNSQDIAGLWAASGAGFTAVYSCGTTDPVLQIISCTGGTIEGYVSTAPRSDGVALYNCAPGGGYTGDNFVQTGACERGVPTVLGYAQQPSYQGGKPTEIRNTASGRALTLGWDSGSYKVTSVATPTVAAHGGPLTWSYTYDAATAALTSVCGPGTPAVCTTYTNTMVATVGGVVSKLTSVTTPVGVNAFNAGYAVDGGVAWRDDPAGNRWTFETRTNDAILADNPSGYWRVADTSGTTAVAQVGTNATYANTSPSAFGAVGANITRGDVNGAVALDGADDSISLPSGYASIGTTGFGFTAWIKPTNLTGTRRILELGVAGTNTGVYMERTSSGALTAGVGDGTTYKTVTTGSGKLAAGTWARVGLTIDATGDTKIYVDDTMAKGKRLAVPANVNRSNNRIGTDGTSTLAATIDEVATFATALSATRLQAQLTGRRLVVTEPALAGQSALSQSYVHDTDGKMTTVTDQAGSNTNYAYDSRGFLASVTDPNGNATTYLNDAAGRRVQTSVKRGATTLTSYVEYCVQGSGPCSAYATGDPRLGRVIATRDARSASATDNTYKTSFAYDAQGRKLSTTTPATTAFPSGRTAQTTYTVANSDPAIGGGYAPAGLVKTSVDPAGAVTTNSYDAKGDLRRVTAASGALTDYTYDEIGRPLTTAVTANSATTTMSTVTYDGWSRPVTETGPAVVNTVTGVTHQARATTTYNNDGQITSVITSDLNPDSTTRDQARTVTTTYDTAGRLQTTVASGGTTTTTYDTLGRVSTVAHPDGLTLRYAYTTIGKPASTTAVAVVTDPIDNPGVTRDIILEQHGYDPQGRLAFDVDAVGTVVEHKYDTDDTLTKNCLRNLADPDLTNCDLELASFTYDNNANTTVSVTGNGKTRTEFTYAADGLLTKTTLDPAGLGRTTTLGYDATGRPTSVARSTVAAPSTVETRTMTYDPAGNQTRVTTINGGASYVTARAYDQLGRLTAETTPRGWNGGNPDPAYTTNLTYDVLGRVVSGLAPTVNVETGGGTPTPARPTMTKGYNTFGETTHTRDPENRITTTVFNSYGQVSSQTRPPYTRPDAQVLTPTASATYDVVGRVTTITDPAGNVTSYDYNGLGQPVRRTDPLVAGQPAAGQRRAAYDDAGRPVWAKDPLGAVTTAHYDSRGRVDSTTVIERSPSSSFTTTRTYDDANNLLTTTSPTGVTGTATYNAAGQTTTTKVGTAAPTTYTYDLAGRTTQLVDPMGAKTTTTYDAAGRATKTEAFGTGATVISRITNAYDADGQVLTQTPLAGEGQTNWATSLAYDSAGRVTSKTTTPTAKSADNIVESYGYDAFGRQTRRTDGRGNATITTYQAWGLPESTIEASTTAHPAAGDRTWTATYDLLGRPVKLAAPGGVARNRTFDALGRLISETGSGAEAATATRTLTYDLAGRVLSASHPSGTETFTYNDRALNLTAAGPAGAAAFTYDGDGRMVSRTDAAGAATFTYTNRGLPQTQTDPITNTTRTFAFNDAGDPTSVGWTGGANRSFTYDTAGRLATDTLRNSVGTSIQSTTYGYDNGSNVTSKVTTGGAGAGTNTYTYDRINRLASWTNPAAATTGYAWDAANNRTRAGDKVYTYDQRNRLLTEATSPQRRVLFYTDGDSTHLSAAETAIKDRLEGAGNAVTQVRARDGVAADATNKNLIVVSGNVRSGENGPVLTSTSTVPAVVLARDVFPDFKMTGTGSSAKGGITNSTAVNITAATDPLAAGLPAGTRTVFSSPTELGWGYQTTATRPVEVVGNTTRNPAFRFDTGQTMNIGVAPARRVGFYATKDSADKLTTDGWAMFDAAVAWAAPQTSTTTATSTFSARGTAASTTTTTTTTTQTFDAFDRLVSDASATYAYDALDRLATRGATALSFAGLERDMVADGTSTFAHDPSGAPVALSKGTTSLALNTDAHSDIVGTFTPGGATLTDTKTFDPWGTVTASSGTTNPALGYQSDWTDPTTNKVSMDARFYNPATSSFASRDSLADPAMANRYGYTPANPLRYTDPTGHFLIALPAIGIGAAVLAAATVGGGYLAYRAATGNPVTVKPGVITGAGTAGALALVQGGTAALNSYRGIFETLGAAAGATALAPTSLDYHVRGFNDAITATAAGTLPISGCAPCRDPRKQNAGDGGRGGGGGNSITNSGPSVAHIAALAAAVAATPTARALTNDEKQLQLALESLSVELLIRQVDLSGHNQDQPKPAPPPLGTPQPKRDTECSKNPDDLLAQAATPPHPGHQDPAAARERANYRGEHVAPQTCMVPIWFGQARISAHFQDPERTPITVEPAGFRIRVFADPRAPGVFVAINNRTLANYSLAGAPTAPACLAVPTADERDRLNDDPISPQTSLPSPVVAVTESISDPTPVAPYRVTSTVSVPRNIPPC